MALFLAIAPAALAKTTWYVDGVNGSDTNDCLSSQTTCQTIGHAIALAGWGDTIMVAPAVYTENLTITINLKIIGSDPTTTIVDGNQAGTVITIYNNRTVTHVHLSKLSIRNGSGRSDGIGGGILNSGILTVKNSILSGNRAAAEGGGICNGGTLTISNSTISGNSSWVGGGIYNDNAMTINNSTISKNSAGGGAGAGIINGGGLTINNSTISGNINGQTHRYDAVYGDGAGISDIGGMTINSSTIAGNRGGAGVYHNRAGFTLALQNSIIAHNGKANCHGTVTSIGYNLSSDDTCNFDGTGDMNNTDAKLGKLKDNGGPTPTISLLPGSPAVDAGNPNGCTDDKGNLLKTDQRGWTRPDKQSGRCDIGAFERQKK
jgi:hypothetical protein